MEKKSSLDVSQIPKELRLIMEILMIEDVEYIQTIIQVKFNNINWELFLDLSMHHRVYPLLFSKIKKIDESVIPLFVVKTISQKYMLNTYRMLQFSGEMEQVCKLLTENQIRLLFLKGPVLGEDLYGDVSLRTSGDIDFLISINDLDKAEKLLLKQGYEKDDYIQTVLNDWKWRHHHVTYFHPKKMIKLEIHWRLNPGPGKEPSFIDLWNRKRRSSLTSFPVYYLGKEDLFLFLSAHGARHGWSRLRWLVDINQLIKQDFDRGVLKKLLKKYNVLHTGGQALYLSSQLLNTPIENDLKPVIRGKQPKRLAQAAIYYLEKMVNLHNEPLPIDISIYHKRHLFFLMSKRQRILYFLSFLYPYPEDAKTLPLPNYLHFLYFLLRPFLWAWRKAKYLAIS